jgi:hypothetical protein
MREIENRQPDRRMVFNDRQEKRAVATAHIHDPAEFLEGIIRGQWPIDALGKALHSLIK